MKPNVYFSYTTSYRFAILRILLLQILFLNVSTLILVFATVLIPVVRHSPWLWSPLKAAVEESIHPFLMMNNNFFFFRSPDFLFKFYLRPCISWFFLSFYCQFYFFHVLALLWSEEFYLYFPLCSSTYSNCSLSLKIFFQLVRFGNLRFFKTISFLIFFFSLIFHFPFPSRSFLWTVDFYLYFPLRLPTYSNSFLYWSYYE